MWDVFHSDRLEVERSLTTDAVRAALARGDLRPDDLIRPAGTTPWTRLADMPALTGPRPRAVPPKTKPAPPPQRLPEGPTIADDDFEEFEVVDDDFEEFEIDDEDEEGDVQDEGTDEPLNKTGPQSIEALPIDDGPEEEDEEEEEFDPQEEDEEAAEFTLSRRGPETVEELDLAAMVDVAFQLVLFFLVTATTVLYKSLEVPKPNPESPPGAVAQGRSRTLDDMRDSYIVVEIDPAGAMKIDREPVAARMDALVERLRSAREQTGRKAMLLSADFATAHRNAVLAYDAANEIGLGIAIARPSASSSPAPAAPKDAAG
jgi:biopolymer transport protein ExbD